MASRDRFEAVIDTIESEALLANVRAVSKAYIRSNCIVGPVQLIRGEGFLLGLRTLASRQGSLESALLDKNILTGTSSDPYVLRLLPAYILNERPRRPTLRDALARIPRVSVARFLSLADLGREEVVDLLTLAQALQDEPQPRALAGKILGLLFMNPSLRTLASFQAGMSRLGGSSFVITPGQGTWQLETRERAVMSGAAAEHIREGIPVLASYCDALGVRAFADGRDLAGDLAETLFAKIDALCDKPLINLESAADHPCQALADWRTLDELGIPARARFVLSWVYHPKPLPLAVPAAVLHMAALRGMEVVVARPEGFALPAAVMDRAHAAARASGGSVRETADRAAALSGAHVVYAKEWSSVRHYGDPAADAEAQGRALRLVRARGAGSTAPRRMLGLRTAFPYGATSPWPMRCSMDRARW